MPISRGGVVVTLAGAAGGALVGLLCVGGVVIDVSEYLSWHLIPAAAAQGGLLASTAWVAGRWARGRSAAVKLASGLCAGWIGGYVASFPIVASVSETFTPDMRISHWWEPLQSFGLISAIQSLWFSIADVHRRPGAHIVAAIAAGVGGYLWFWLAVDGSWSWNRGAAFAALLHGVTWGLVVGVATARVWGVVTPPSNRTLQPVSGATKPIQVDRTR